MRRILACLVGLALLGPLASRESLANGMRPYPPIPEPRQAKAEERSHLPPLLPATIGAAAVAMTGSLITLIIIRKRNGK